MTDAWQVAPARDADTEAWAGLRAALWPDADVATHLHDIHGMRARSARIAAFLARDAEGTALGFAEAGVRGDHVNGTDASPVAFLEGWYVAPQARGQGVGRALVAAVEHWAQAQGLRELASDALLDNDASHRAHAACGFEETERVVYFRKALRR